MNHRSLALAAAIAVAGSAIAFAGTSAAAPAMDPAQPAPNHEGSCPTPGKVVASLSDVTSQFIVDGTATATQPMGQTTAIPVEASGTKATIAYADILASPHSIVVHKSADEINVYILCGDIGGPEMGAADLPIGLGALNDSGFSGVAMLHDNGDGTTQVNVVVIPPNGMMTSPQGSSAPMNMSPAPSAAP